MWQSIKFALKHTWNAARNLLLFYVITQIIIAASAVVDLLIFKEITELVTNSPTLLGLSLIGIVILRLTLEITRKILEGFSNYSWALLDTKQVIYMNSKFVDKVASLDIATFENPNTVGLIQRAFSRFQFQFKYYVKAIVEVIAAAVELSVSILIFIIASPLIAVVIIIANLIPIFVRGKYATGTFLIYRADDETKRKFGYTSNLIQERETLPEIKVNQAFEFFKNKIVEIYRQWNNKQLVLEKKYVIYNTTAEFLPILSIFVFLLVIANQAIGGSISPGTFIFLFTNVFVFSGSLNRLSQNLGHLYADSLFINEAVEFFNLKSNIAFPIVDSNKRNELLSKIENPAITIENASFMYPGDNNLVLKNISLKIPYGQNLALIGENGAGKTTLVKLLLRMYDPTEGRILINDVDLKELPEDILFKIYSSLFQSFGKFYLTVRENLEIAAGRKLSDEEMVNYLKFSSAWDFIKDKKNGLNQQLGPEYKEGTDLSGGQWQKLAIARAYAKRAFILILDEPTSAVDAKSEMEIFDRLNREMKKNTLIFISHRFSTIKDAERIVVIDKGKIIEDGTHSKLMEAKGKYHKLYTIQAERYKRN